MKLDNPFDAKDGGPRPSPAALGGPYWIRDWMDMNRNLFAALQLEKLALFVIVTHHRAGGRLRHHRPPGAAGGREAEGDRDPQGDGRRGRGSIGAVFLVAGMLIGVVGHGGGQRLRACS